MAAPASTALSSGAPVNADPGDASNLAQGLPREEAERRLEEYGENLLADHRAGFVERIARFFWGPIPWMIEAAALLSAALRHWDDLVIILAMLLINAGVGFWQEFKAGNAIVVTGPQASPYVQAAAAQLNQKLGAPVRMVAPLEIAGDGDLKALEAEWRDKLGVKAVSG